MTHTYTEDQLVPQSAIGLSVTKSMCPAVARSKILCESLVACIVNLLFLKTFLFEWKTAE
jgi:hypothetical protein